ncbi:MAG TPA: MMPL family transporter [Mycobacteriales bacterium]
MLTRWAAMVDRRRWWVLGTALVLALAVGTVSSGLVDRLKQGGYEVPGSESVRTDDVLQRALGRQAADAVMVYTAPAGTRLSDPQLTAAVRATVEGLPRSRVASAVGWWQAPALLSEDRRTGAVTLRLVGDDTGARITSWRAISGGLRGTPGRAHGVDGLTVRFTGEAPMGAQILQQAQADLHRAELVSFPILLVLLVFVFGGLVAAGLPLVVGGLAIVGALGVLRLFTGLTDVSVFAMNIVTLLGLGLAIDYGLFMVSRFREELSKRPTVGRPDVRVAVQRTLFTAGRTILVSGLTVMAALSGLLVFPQTILRSIGLGGVAAVAVSALAAVTVLPALLAVLGHRVDALRVPVPWRRRSAPSASGGAWRRVGRAVMRRPIVVVLVVGAALVVFGLPFLGAKFGLVDASVLPKGNDVRVATETLNRHLPDASGDGTEIAVVGRGGEAPPRAAVARVVTAVRGVDGVAQVAQTAAKRDVVLLDVRMDGGATSDRARAAVADLRALRAPDGVGDILVGGQTAQLVDTVDAVGAKLPALVAVLAAAVILLMFLAFGSLVIPLKAIVMSSLSLGASFGAVIWIFQDGHLADFFGITPGPVDATIPVLMLAILFGLSTDYEVFLLSRIAEASRAGKPLREAVAYGLERTGGIITSAALLLMVVIGAFSLSGLTFMKLIGVGMFLAIAVDASIVRALLVPATMVLLGQRVTWWAPAWTKRIQQRVGLEEVEPPDEDEAPRTVEPVGAGAR